MRNDHVTLRSTAVFDLLAPRTPAVPVQVELRYDTRDPYAVVAAFRTGRAGWVEWVYARDLLADGLDSDGLDSGDRATLDRLLDPADQASVHHRPDLFVLSAHTLYTAVRPA